MTSTRHRGPQGGETARPGAFAAAVEGWVRRIPSGMVASYGDIAALAGSPRAARGVGAVLNGLEPDSGVPWWRVVNRVGQLSIPAEWGRRALQRTLLRQEDVRFGPDGGVDLEHHHWRGPLELDDSDL